MIRPYNLWCKKRKQPISDNYSCGVLAVKRVMLVLKL